MRNATTRLVLVLVVFAGLAAVWVIPSYANGRQVPGTLSQPGVSPARFWINNKTREESIPVNIVVADPKESPLPVTVRGVTSVAVNGLVPVTASRQTWEYREASFTPTQGLAAGLNTLGNDAWEVTGMTTQPNGRVTVLLKRPR